jgi:hypothetical protein
MNANPTLTAIVRSMIVFLSHTNLAADRRRCESSLALTLHTAGEVTVSAR